MCAPYQTIDYGTLYRDTRCDDCPDGQVRTSGNQCGDCPTKHIYDSTLKKCVFEGIDCGIGQERATLASCKACDTGYYSTDNSDCIAQTVQSCPTGMKETTPCQQPTHSVRNGAPTVNSGTEPPARRTPRVLPATLSSRLVISHTTHNAKTSTNATPPRVEHPTRVWIPQTGQEIGAR